MASDETASDEVAPGTVAQWTCAADEVPGLRGQAVYLVAPDDRAEVERALDTAGYELRVAEGTAQRRSTMAAICRALGVREASNLDAFADVLRDVQPTTPQRRVALLWLGSDLLAAADLEGWRELSDILAGASAEHWDPDDDADPSNLVFETVAVTAGFGVRPLA